MVYLCLDTCTWIYLANGFEPGKLIGYLEQQTFTKNIKLIVPKILLEEWDRNKGSAIKQTEYDFKKGVEHLQQLEYLISGDDLSESFYELLGTDEDQLELAEKRKLNNFFDSFKGKLDFFKKKVNDNLKSIDKLLKSDAAIYLEETDSIRLTALNMGLRKDPPFQSKNSVADAIIFLQFIDYIKSNNILNSYFISWNKTDFCINKSSSLHPNLNEMLLAAKAKFFPALSYAVHHIEADLLTIKELKELERRQQQMFLDDHDEDDYFCKCCQETKSVISPIFFHAGTEIQDERSERDYNQLSLFGEENVFEDGFLVRPETKEFLSEAECGYCGAEHIRCPECGYVMEFSIDKEYNKVQYCDQCNLKFNYRQTVGRKGDIEGIEFIILSDLPTCALCGEEYENERSGSSLCAACEENYAYNK